MGRGAAARKVGSLKRVVASAVVFLAGAFASGASAAAPLVVRATFATPSVWFAGVINMHVIVLLDAKRVRPDSLRIVDDLAPLTSLSPARTTRKTQGSTITIAVGRTFGCLSGDCASASGDATPALPPVRVTVVTLGGKTLRASAALPTLHVRGRVSKADLGRSSPRFRANTTPAPPSYRLAPTTLARLLDGIAVVLALAGAALALYEARRFARRRRGEPTIDEFERALRLAREAENRPPPDRRRALGLLARLLAARDRPLSAAASDLAWSEPEPERRPTLFLVGVSEERRYQLHRFRTPGALMREHQPLSRAAIGALQVHSL